MDKNPPPIKRAVLVENKRFTHDMFVKEGFAHLRPATVSFPRSYSADLAGQILHRLKASERDGVVLKLCNRSRGAGIIVVPGNESELDEMLRSLLVPPPEEDLMTHIPGLTGMAMGTEPADHALEQKLHWWSNECPVFIAERLCHSIPVAKHPDSDEKYDGTMRVAFALHRKQAVNKHAHMRLEPELIKPFEIDWLGGYWKLPKAASAEGGGGEGGSLHDQIVSSFNSVDKRTAEVPQEHLDEIYESLTLALPQIFHTGSLGVAQILSLYKQEPLFCSFALARVAATMRQQEMPKAKQVYDMSKKKVELVFGPEDDLAKRSLQSYIDRNEGVCDAMLGEWDEAERKFFVSKTRLYTNSTAWYLLGCCQHERSSLSGACHCYNISAAFDPDFKAPYLALGNCYLQMRNFREAINAGAACLRRNPDAPQAQFIIGQAIYHLQFRNGRNEPKEVQEEMEQKATAALTIAKERMSLSWTEVDEQMLSYFLSDEASRRTQEQVPVHPWKISGWRP